jgi:hypothetical protein
VREHRRVIGAFLEHHEDVHNPLLKSVLAARRVLITTDAIR